MDADRTGCRREAASCRTRPRERRDEPLVERHVGAPPRARRPPRTAAPCASAARGCATTRAPQQTAEQTLLGSGPQIQDSAASESAARRNQPSQPQTADADSKDAVVGEHRYLLRTCWRTLRLRSAAGRSPPHRHARSEYRGCPRPPRAAVLARCACDRRAPLLGSLLGRHVRRSARRYRPPCRGTCGRGLARAAPGHPSDDRRSDAVRTSGPSSGEQPGSAWRRFVPPVPRVRGPQQGRSPRLSPSCRAGKGLGTQDRLTLERLPARPGRALRDVARAPARHSLVGVSARGPRPRWRRRSTSGQRQLERLETQCSGAALQRRGAVPRRADPWSGGLRPGLRVAQPFRARRRCVRGVSRTAWRPELPVLHGHLRRTATLASLPQPRKGRSP